MLDPRPSPLAVVFYWCIWLLESNTQRYGRVEERLVVRCRAAWASLRARRASRTRQPPTPPAGDLAQPR